MCNDTGSSTTIIHCVKDSHISPQWTFHPSSSEAPGSDHQQLYSSTSGKYGKLSQIFRELIFRFINWRRRFFSSLNSTAFVRAQSGEIYANGCHRGTCGVDAFFCIILAHCMVCHLHVTQPNCRTSRYVCSRCFQSVTKKLLINV